MRQQRTIQASIFDLFAIQRIVVEDDPLPVGGEDGRSLWWLVSWRRFEPSTFTR
jgi:hypothetical protein